LVLGACEQAREIIPGAEEEPEVPEAAFQLGEVLAIDPQSRPDSPQKANEAAAKVVELINSFYTSAFFDPALWQGGAHPDLAALFTAEAQPGLQANLGSLAMAELSDQVESVESTSQQVHKVTFFVEDDGSLPIGVATVTFDGVAKPAGGGDDAAVKHAAHFWLQREGDSYRISAFESAVVAAEEPGQ
jgi:hypothetical protein